MEWEETRAAELLEAQSKAVELFNQIEERELIRPGITEKDLNADIYALFAMFIVHSRVQHHAVYRQRHRW